MIRSIVTAALGYFAIVFGAGFLLALVRIPLLVPWLGVRYAELVEMPVMLAVILWAAAGLVRRHPSWSRSVRLACGMFALVLMIAAELAVGFSSGAESLQQIIAARDPVSGAVYAFALLVFALAPAAWPSPDRK